MKKLILVVVLSSGLAMAQRQEPACFSGSAPCPVLVAPSVPWYLVPAYAFVNIVFVIGAMLGN